MDLKNIANQIKELEDMPNNEKYYEACILVAENVYELSSEDAIKVADIIREDLNKGGVSYDEKSCL